MKKRYILYTVGGMLLALAILFVVLPAAASILSGLLGIVVAGIVVVAIAFIVLPIVGISLIAATGIAIVGAAIIAVFSIFDVGNWQVSAANAHHQSLNLFGVKRIKIYGQAADLHISTKDGVPFNAELEGRLDGWKALWHSIWSGDVCNSHASMSIDGDTLEVDVGHGWSDWENCKTVLTANLPPQVAVKIDQDASHIFLDGKFSAVAIESAASDVTIRGHVEALWIKGAALKVQAIYETVKHNENIAIFGKALNANLRFMTPTPISYKVEGTMSYFKSRLPNTPGVKPAIYINGDMVHVTIE